VATRGTVARPGRVPSSQALTPPFTVSHIIAAVLKAYHSGHAGLGLGLSGDPGKYDMRIAEDDGSVDPDFPELDPSVTLTTVGVDKFVMCERATDRPVLRVTIPAAAMRLRACEQEGGPAGRRSATAAAVTAGVVGAPDDGLLLTCYQPVTGAGGGAAAATFTAPAPSSKSFTVLVPRA
jgi:hypothetical protein